MKTLYTCQSVFFNQFFCILFFAIFAITSQAQTWPEPGATWEYCLFNSNGTTRTYTYTNDTVISDTTYAIVQLAHQNGESILGSNLSMARRMYFRNSNDTIFRRVYNIEYVYFINGLEIGDSFIAYRSSAYFSNQYSCDPEMQLEVVNIEDIEIEGESLTRVSMEDIHFSEVYEGDLLPSNPVYQFIEGVGPNSNFPYFFSLAANNDSSYCYLEVKPTVFSELLISYSDNLHSYTFGECVPTSLKELPSVQLKIFPNPVSTNQFQIENSEGVAIHSIQLFDQQGRILELLNPANRFHSLGDLPAGLYIIQIETDHGFTWEKLVKE